jgi:hypothetical protein
MIGRLLSVILLFSVAADASFLFRGTLAADNQVALFSITANSAENIAIQTAGYAGGVVNATTITPGGFAPTAFLFDNLGNVLTLTAGTCGQVGSDPTTQNCDDLFFQDTLGPGTFTLALAVYDNRPVDTSVSDGFVEDGNPGFTCQAAGGSGNFCDLTAAFPLDNARSGDYGIAFTGADSVVQLGVPEPASLLLLLAGAVFTALRLRHSDSQ